MYLSASTSKYNEIPPYDISTETLLNIRWNSLVLESATVTISEPAAEGSWGFPKISEKVPSEKKQGVSSDDTSICPIIPASETELWLAVAPEPSNREANFHLKVRWVRSVD